MVKDVFLRIILQLRKPVLITIMVLNSLWIWNEILIAMIFLQKNDLHALMVRLIQFQDRFQVNQPVLIAGLFVLIILIILIYLLGQRYFVSGLTSGTRSSKRELVEFFNLDGEEI